MADNTEFNYSKSRTAVNAIAILGEHGTYAAERVGACMETELVLSEFIPNILTRASDQIGSLLALVSLLELFLVEKSLYTEFREWEVKKLEAMHSESKDADSAENN